MPAMPIDAHFHCWQLARADYGWLNPLANPALAPICRDIGVHQWQAEAEPRGVQGGVLVQAAPTAAETGFLLAQAAEHSSVLGVVGWVDWLAPNAATEVHRLARLPKLKGLRPMLQDLDDPAWILAPAVQPALAAMADAGLVFDALVKPVHLPHILTLAQRHPTLRIVIDHAAKPDIAAGQWQPWADAMARLADETGAVCKVSGLLTEAGPRPSLTAPLRWMQHLSTTFGPHRLLWGSDWPVLEISGATYADWHTTCTQWVADWTTEAQAGFWGGNARRVYDL